MPRKEAGIFLRIVETLARRSLVCVSAEITDVGLCCLLTYYQYGAWIYSWNWRIMCKVMITLKTEVVHLLIGLQTRLQVWWSLCNFWWLFHCFTSNVLHFIWTSHIKCLSRIDFDVVSRNLNSSPEIQDVQIDHGLATQTPGPALASQVVYDARYPITDVATAWSKDVPGI